MLYQKLLLYTKRGADHYVNWCNIMQHDAPSRSNPVVVTNRHALRLGKGHAWACCKQLSATGTYLQDDTNSST